MVSAPACSCDCCVSQWSNRVVASGLECLPREAISGGSCSSVCSCGEGQQALFLARSAEVDYARFCSAECHPASDMPNLLCAAGLPSLTVTHKALKAMTQESQAVQSDSSSGEVLELKLAKAEMEKAEAHARTAGAAARFAYDSWQLALLSSKEMAKKASEATLDSLKARAKEQISEVTAAKAKYERQSSSMAWAHGGAQLSADYHKAMGRIVETADSWAKRADEFEEAAKVRSNLAQSDSIGAELAKQQGNEKLYEEKSLQALQEMHNAEDLQRKAASVREHSDSVREALPWYHRGADLAASFAPSTAQR